MKIYDTLGLLQIWDAQKDGVAFEQVAENKQKNPWAEDRCWPT